MAGLVGGANWVQIWTAVAASVAGLGAIAAGIGAWVAVRQLKDPAKMRNISLFMDMCRRWDDKSLVRVRRGLDGFTPESFRVRYESGKTANNKDFYDLQKLANFFEDYGTLELFGDLSAELINSAVGRSLVHYWQLWEPAVRADRLNRGDLYDNWESLYKKVARLRLPPSIPLGS